MTDTAATSADISPVDAIRIGERDRSEMGNLDELAASITAVGLLHPIVVTADLDLVAGGRRLAAIKQLGWDEVPVTVVDLTSAADVLRAELEENTCRKPLSPLEASYARERRAKVLAPQIQENRGGRPAKVEPDIPQDGFWVEPGAAETSGKLPEVLPDRTARETRSVASVGTGFSPRSIDKVDEIRQIAEQGTRTVGTGITRHEEPVPEPVREVARQQMPALAQTGAAIEPAHQAVRRAMEEHLGVDPKVQQSLALKNLASACAKLRDLSTFNAENVATAIDAQQDRAERWLELERLHATVDEWFDRLQDARSRPGLRLA